MMRSMYSAISGLRAHQVKMDVIANNISNVNTVGFKSSRVTFQEVLNQTIQPAFGSVAGGMGGTNVQQIGLGVSVGSIDVLHNPSSVQRTDRALDVAIDGEGFFTVSDGTQTFYTRAGNFYIDDSGTLVTQSGYKVLDVNLQEIQPAELSQCTDISISKDGKLTGISNGQTIEMATLGITMFPNPQGLMKEGDNLYSETPNSGAAVVGAPGIVQNGVKFSSLKPGSLEMSNVDLSQEFTDMIIAQRGFQANSRVITTSNEMLQDLVQIIR